MAHSSTKVIDNFKDMYFSGLTLKFNDSFLEKQFKKEYFFRSLLTIRVSFAISVLLYAAFGFLDFSTAFDYYKEFFIVRYLFIFPIGLFVLFISFSRLFIKIWQPLTSFYFVTAGTGIIYMLHTNPENIFYYGGMFLIFIGGYFFVKLPFYPAAISGAILIVVYNLSALLFSSYYSDHMEYIYVTNVFFISANLMSMYALYNIESLERKGYYQRFLLSEKQSEIVDINKNLEAQVEERTTLLNSRNQKLVLEIDHRKEVEEMLYHAKEKAEESDRLKSAFLSNMSHEIRTPMNGILGFIELLKAPDISKDEQKEYFKVVTDSSDRLLFTINDIIEISKIESNQVSLNMSSESIEEILNHHHTFFIPEAESKNIKLTINKTLKGIVVNTDKLKLQSILTNLIKNALKFTSKGGIEFGCELDNNKLVFYVNDSGAGIPENRIKGIFNRFEQADLGINRGYEGSGLGLSIAKAYCEMLGGKIWVESELGKGSTFYFEIDFNPVKKKEMAKQIEPIVQESIETEINVLLVEDDEMSASLIQAMLNNEKFKLFRVKNGKEAVETVKANRDFDLVLMDIRMPVLDGIEATKQIRKFNKEITIVAQTAYALVGDKEKALDAGCDDYLTKPIKKNKLIGKIQELFE